MTSTTTPTATAAATAHGSAIGLQFRVTQPNGRAEQILVDAERALIGSAAHCEVRLPSESAAREHVEVFASSRDRVHMAPRPNEIAPSLDGQPCASEGLWPAGGVLVIGGTTIVVETIDLSIRQRGWSPFWLFLPVAIVAIVATVFFQQAKAPSEPPIPQAVTLFDAPIATCASASAPTPAALANEKLRLALTKRERGPFSPSDAVDAVALFESAAACFRAASLVEEERDAREAGSTLRRKVEEEYHTRRVRLEHAFRVGDPFSAKRELVVLVPMTSRRTGTPYVEWLAAVDRQATLEVEQRTNRRNAL